MKISRLAKKILYAGLLTTTLLLPAISAQAEGKPTTTVHEFPWQVSMQTASTSTDATVENDPASLKSETVDTSQQSTASSDSDWKYVPIRRLS